MAKKIAETAEVVVAFEDLGGHHLLITFAPLNFICGPDEFWGDAFVRKAGFSAIGFTSKRGNWYPAKDMEYLISQLDDILSRFAHRISYGSSMGGYGALKYSRRLDVSAALAFGAQASIDPADGIVNIEFTKYFDNVLHDQMSVKGSEVAENSYLFFDSKVGFDLQNATLLKNAATHLKIVDVPHAGHDCLKVAASTPKMSELIRLCLVGEWGPVKSYVREMRATSKARKSGLARALLKKRPECARRLVEGNAGIMDDKQLGLFYDTLAVAYLRSNQLDKALMAADIAHGLLPTHEAVNKTRAACLARTSAGALEGAAFGKP